MGRFSRVDRAIQTVESAFQLTDVGLDIRGDIGNDIVVDVVALQFLFFPQDGHSCFKIRRRYVGDQTAFKTGPKTFLQSLNVLGRPVTGDDDLLVGRVKGVEGMEKFLLCTLFL